MDREYKLGEKVYLRDYPWGRPLSIYGKIVGYLNEDTYNVLLSNGLNAGNIRPFKEWSLIREQCPMSAQKQEQVEDSSGEADTQTPLETFFRK